MLSQLHEVLVAMVRENEGLARAIAQWATGHRLPDDLQLRTRDQSYSELKPPEYRAGLVLETLEVLLRARQFHLDDAIRVRLQACDAAELDALVVRATNIERIDDLFQD